MTIDYTSPIGQVRLIIGDLNEDEFEYTDEQIEGFLNLAYGNIGQASLNALRGLVAMYAVTSGDSYKLDTIQYTEGKQKSAYFQSLMKDLQDAINNGTSPLSVGQMRPYGIYVNDKKANYKQMKDGVIIPPRFKDNETDEIKRTSDFGPYYG